VVDLPTLRAYIEGAGCDAKPEGLATIRITPRDGGPDVPPFFAQLGENWVALTMLPMLPRNAYRADDLGRRLLAANREMRVAKFALDKEGDVVLCAELPTESLDASEIAVAVHRMVEYARRFSEP
jgi:hypothetical protein